MKRWIKRLGILLGVLLLLVTAGWQFENWRGARALEKAYERAEELGISLDLADYIPDEVPEDENFMLHPDLKAEWEGEVDPGLRGFYWIEGVLLD